MTRPAGMELTDYIHQLTAPHPHQEPYQIRTKEGWETHHHTTRTPPLLTQIEHAQPSATGAEDRTNDGYASRPAARLEALDALHRIDQETSWWYTRLHHDRARRDTLPAVQHLGSLAPQLTACDNRKPGCCDRHELEHDARRWWTLARIVSGWDSPPWRPDNACPLCGVRGGLRVKLTDKVGFCADCGEAWDETSIGLLADHIRDESEAEREPSRTTGPCWCPLPRPRVGDLSRLCRSCGSARCTHALQQRLVDTLVGARGVAS